MAKKDKTTKERTKRKRDKAKFRRTSGRAAVQPTADSDILTPARLRKAQGDYIDKPIGDLGTFRVLRLDMDRKLEIVALLDATPKDAEGNITDTDDALAFAVELLGYALLGFDSDEGRDEISNMHPQHLAPLIETAMELNDMKAGGPDPVAAKKN